MLETKGDNRKDEKGKTYFIYTTWSSHRGVCGEGYHLSLSLSLPPSGDLRRDLIEDEQKEMDPFSPIENVTGTAFRSRTSDDTTASDASHLSRADMTTQS